MGGAKDKDVFDKFARMDSMNFQTALLSAHLSTKFLAEQGLICFTGAATVFEGPVNFAFAYAMTKSTTHALAQHLAQREEIPESTTVLTILP